MALNLVLGVFCLATYALSVLGAPPVRLQTGGFGSIQSLINIQRDLENEDEALVIATSGTSRKESNATAHSKSGSALRDAKPPELAKRGIGFWGTYGGVTDIQALTALKDLAWWYTWGSGYTSTAAGNLAVQNNIEFVPMLWNKDSNGNNIPAGSKYLLGYNEPNVRPQSNTAPYQAAQGQTSFNAVASQKGLKRGTPSAAPCPGADYSTDCVLRTQWDWWSQYFASCNALNINCTPDFIATHLYTCSPTILTSYIDALWRQFKKPIWITEFACCLANSKLSADETLAKQITYMRTAMSIMDNDSRVFRYAWFAPRVTGFTCLGDTANLMNSDASLTTLGKVYINKPINTTGLPTVVAQAVTATIPPVPLVPWDEACFPCDASSSFWTMQSLLKNAGNNAVYRSFIDKCRLCGYQDEWNKTPL